MSLLFSDYVVQSSESWLTNKPTISKAATMLQPASQPILAPISTPKWINKHRGKHHDRLSHPKLNFHEGLLILRKQTTQSTAVILDRKAAEPQTHPFIHFNHICQLPSWGISDACGTCVIWGKLVVDHRSYKNKNKKPSIKQSGRQWSASLIHCGCSCTTLKMVLVTV